MHTEKGVIKDHGYMKPLDISRDDYFMDIVRVIGEKGTCDRGRSGCVIVRDEMVLATAFVTSPEGSPTCDEVGHQMWHVIHEDGRETEHCMRNNCAEQGAIANAVKQGISLEWATLYATMTPCTVRHCAHLIVACGIKRVVCDRRYHDAKESEKIFNKAGVEFVYLHDEVQKY